MVANTYTEHGKTYVLLLHVDAYGFPFSVRQRIKEQAKQEFRRFCNRHGIPMNWWALPGGGIAFYAPLSVIRRVEMQTRIDKKRSRAKETEKRCHR